MEEHKVDGCIHWIHPQKRRAGFSLVEVTIAMAITVMMSAGLYTMGIQVRRSADRNRLSTEARSFAKERLEMIIEMGLDNLKKPNIPLLEPTNFTSSMHYVITQTPRLIWHAADGSIVAAEDADFLEVHLDVAYRSPQSSKILTDTYSTLIN